MLFLKNRKIFLYEIPSGLFTLILLLIFLIKWKFISQNNEQHLKENYLVISELY